MIFGSDRDRRMYLHIGRELLRDIVEQECLFYKIDLETTIPNIYGESEEKGYWSPVRLTCLIKRQEQEWSEQEYGSDPGNTPSFAFFREDFREINSIPEVGDIVEWNKNYYEVDGVVENQLWLGKNQDYRLDDTSPKDRTHKFGHSVSFVCSTHLTRYTRLNITRQN